MAFTDDPFGRLTFGGVYARSLALLTERLDLFMVIAIIMYVPYLLLQLSFPAAADNDSTTDGPTDPATNSFLGDDADGNPTQLLLAPLIGVYAELFFATFVGVIGQAAVAIAVGQMYTNGHPDTIRCLRAGLRNFCCTLFCGQIIVMFGLTATNTVVIVIVMLTFLSGSKILGIIAALAGATVVVVVYFYTMVATTLFIPVVMVESRGSIDGLRRSLELVNRDFCFVFCVRFCFGCLTLMITLFISLSTWDGLLGTAIKKLPFLFQFPLSAILTVVMYFNLRVKQEGLNRDVLSRELNGDCSGGDGLVDRRHHGDYDHVLSVDDDVVAIGLEATAVAVAEKV